MDPNTQSPTTSVENETPPTQQPTQASTLPEKPPRLTKRVKILIAIVLTILILLIAGAAGAYLYSNSSQVPARENEAEKISAPTSTPDPTADWKTFQGNGFTFKYPSDVIIEEEQNGAKGFITDLDDLTINITRNDIDLIENDDLDKWYKLSISISDNPQLKLTPSIIIDNYIKKISKSQITSTPGYEEKKIMSQLVVDKINSSLKDYKNGELVGLYAVFGSEYDYETIIQTKNGKIYMFMYDGIDGSKLTEKNAERVNQILSTFKFTDPNADETEDLKTYKSPYIDNLGYEIQAPSNWLPIAYGGSHSPPSPIELTQGFLVKDCEATNQETLYVFHYISNDPDSYINNFPKELTSSTFNTNNGIEVKKIIQENNENSKYYYYLIKSSQGYYRIDGKSYCSINLGDKFDNVIKTFKFTE